MPWTIEWNWALDDSDAGDKAAADDVDDDDGDSAVTTQGFQTYTYTQRSEGCSVL
jgi:hypothetical protein